MQTFSAVVVKNEQDLLEFDFIGLDCAIANSFRRIMLAEVKLLRSAIGSVSLKTLESLEKLG